MKIRSLIISTLLVSGLSLGLSTTAQARDTHYSVTLHGGGHGYSQPYHHRSRHHAYRQRHHNFGHHYKRYHGYYRSRDHHGSGHHGKHYGRLGDYHSDRYLIKRRHHGSHQDQQDSHDNHGRRDRRDRHKG